MRTIPDLQEPDKQVSSRHERLPFFHLSLFRIPFHFSSLPFHPPPSHPPQCQSPFSTAMETACGKTWLFGKTVASKVEEAAMYNRHSWP